MTTNHPTSAPAWADRLHADFAAAFTEASGRPDGLIGRGPNRHYFAVHPEQVTGFVDLISHPTVTALCREVLGPDYLFVELGFDVPFPGATMQPWPRDFPSAVTGDTDQADTAVHDLFLTRRFHEPLPDQLRAHLRCTVVDELSPIAQKHDIEGLVMG